MKTKSRKKEEGKIERKIKIKKIIYKKKQQSKE